TPRSAQSGLGRATCRRKTTTPCRSTRISASFAASFRARSTSQPNTRTMKRQMRRISTSAERRAAGQAHTWDSGTAQAHKATAAKVPARADRDGVPLYGGSYGETEGHFPAVRLRPRRRQAKRSGREHVCLRRPGAPQRDTPRPARHLRPARTQRLARRRRNRPGTRRVRRGEIRIIHSRVSGRDQHALIISNDALNESATAGWTITAPIDTTGASPDILVTVPITQPIDGVI